MSPSPGRAASAGVGRLPWRGMAGSGGDVAGSTGQFSIPRGGGKTGPRPIIPTESSLRDGNIAKEDVAAQRILRTPRVFQSNKDTSAHRGRRELRANLLPSILRTPCEVAAMDSQQKSVELDGEFYQFYNERLGQRALAENELGVFLERDMAINQPDVDPQQIVASACTVFRDLVSDQAKKFRRSRDGVVNTASELPFSYPGQPVDLEELADILTLDVERYEIPLKGTAKRPGFTSLQIASRVPFVVKDPLANSPGNGGGAKLKSERLSNGVHAMRLDLQPGEVRQIAYSLGAAEFKRTKLAARMVALVSPEESVLAEIVRMLRSKEGEVKAVTSVLNDILRGLPTELSEASAELDEEAATDEVARAARLEAITKEPRQTIRRLLDTLGALTELISPLLPSLAHTLDRATLIFVREMDRLASRCHNDYEDLYKCWAVAEQERKRFAALVNSMGVKSEVAATGTESRNLVTTLQESLSQQENLYVNLLREKEQQESVAEESARFAMALKARVSELEAAVDRYRKEKKHVPLSDPSSPVVPGSPHGQGLQRGRPTRQRDQLLPFAVHKSVQTETEHYFTTAILLAEELSFTDHFDILQTAARFYHRLCCYEWNERAKTFLVKRTRDIGQLDDDADGVDASMMIASKIVARPSLTKHEFFGEVDIQVAKHLVALHKLKIAVERASTAANASQLEAMIHQLKASVRKGFDVWVAGFLGEDGESGQDCAHNMPVTPEKLWHAIMDSANAEGLKQRVRELESHLSSLLPLAERARNEQMSGNASTDQAFWIRAMRAARQAIMVRASKRHEAQRSLPLRATISGADGYQDEEVPIAMGMQHVLAEINGIWDFLAQQGEHVMGMYSQMRPSAVQAMRSAMKTFYLRRKGRLKHVETAIVALCHAVFEHWMDNAKIALFAVVSEIQPAIVIHEFLPRPLRRVGFGFNVELLDDLPADAPFALAVFIQDLRCSTVEPEGKVRSSFVETDTTVQWVPLHVALTTGTKIMGRSRITAAMFELLLFAFVQFLDGEEAEENRGHFALASATDNEAGIPKPLLQHEILIVSHVLSAYFARRCAHDPDVDDDSTDSTKVVIDELWNQLVQPDTGSLEGLRANLGLESASSTVSVTRLSTQLVDLRVLNLPVQMVKRSIQAFVGCESVDAGDANDQQVGKTVFVDLVSVCKQEGSAFALCSEAVLIWIALWALAVEREHEVDLMGQLFTLYGASGDGILRIEEFKDFISTVLPELRGAECEDLFLSGSEDDSGDMTREVFTSISRRLGIASNVDLLEDLVKSKRNAMYGHSATLQTSLLSKRIASDMRFEASG